jgi:large subunit ribosomal protein L21
MWRSEDWRKMKYAIVETGGKQYRAEEGKTLTVDLLPAKVGDEVILKSVLLIVDDDQVIVGSPKVKGASLKTTVVDQIKGKKILVFKYKPKNNYRRHTGHRQKYTSCWWNQFRWSKSRWHIKKVAGPPAMVVIAVDNGSESRNLVANR